MNGNDSTEGAVAGALAGIRVVELAHIMAGPVCGRMLASCDVVIENFRNGVMEGFGLGYESLRAANPGLVYCQITGFGRTGPLADHRGVDLIAQGMTALHARRRTGKGQRVDTSLYEAGLVETFWQSAVALATGESPGPPRLRPPPRRPLRGLPHRRWLDHRRGMEPGQLAAPAGRPGAR